MEIETEKKTCNAEPEVYSRVTGFYRPTKLWNKGKKQEWKERKMYDLEKCACGR